MDNIEFVKIITPLTVALGLSLTVERVLEIAKHFFEPFLRSGMVTFFTDPKRTGQAVGESQKALSQLDDHINKLESLTPLEKTREAQGDGNWEEDHTLSTVLITPATDADDGTTMKLFILQILGFAVGILIARIFELRLFNVFLSPFDLVVKPNMDYLITGLVLGGGSKPIHLLIRLMTQRRFTSVESETRAEETEEKKTIAAVEAATTPSVSLADDSNWIDIPYKGGVDLELLENIHMRPANPNLVVFHHTAMHSDSTFDDVVQTIKKRNWATGYHCVILKDGSIHPFCRWDRFGCHAKGHNPTSLGISFNGNFEMGGGAGNNTDGRFGIKLPTDAQLKSGARVVALWAHLYKDIDPDFSKSIQPHRNLKATACPGSAFPIQEFQKWVDYYISQWKNSPIASMKIEIFKKKPYLYV